MTRDALILAAHGSRHFPNVNAAVAELAARVAARVDFAVVRAAFNQGEPRFDRVLDAIDADCFTVVPIMTSRGYFADHFLPDELAKNKRFSVTNVHVTQPVGTHPWVVDLVADRIDHWVGRCNLNAQRLTVVIVGHGTERNLSSSRACAALASSLRDRRSASGVVCGFLDQDPRIENVVGSIDESDVLVIPFLIGAGMHSAQDIPQRIGMSPATDQPLPRREFIKGQTLICDRPFGDDPRLADLIVDIARHVGKCCDRHRSESDRSTLRLGTRGSRLALWQSEQVARRLRDAGMRVELVALEASGDTMPDRAITDLPSDAPFTDTIEAALMDGEIDLAVHSLKDLPLVMDGRLVLAAVLPRGDVREALVSRDGQMLAELPHGARVGTSSRRRAVQLRRLRSDLVSQPIRGAVEKRVEQVHDGRFDAAVLAVAGLQRLGLEDAISERFDPTRFMPAAGQAAIVVQTRVDNERIRDAVRALDHAPTRQAIEAELAFARAADGVCGFVAAAFATAGDEILLHAGLLALDSERAASVTVSGSDPAELGERALSSLSARFRIREGAAA